MLLLMCNIKLKKKKQLNFNYPQVIITLLFDCTTGIFVIPKTNNFL